MHGKRTMSIIDLIDEKALDQYLDIVESVTTIDRPKIRSLALDAVRYYKGDADVRSILRVQQEVEGRWYRSLDAGAPDYSVYDDEWFMSEVWACWVVYSRKYIRAMNSPKATRDGSLVQLFSDLSSAIDLGCGFGYSTAGLKELFPHATVTGTNLETSVQFKVATKIGRERGFSMVPAATERADLVFASEYFEHFDRPIAHLLDVIRTCEPKYFVIANAFGATSIGHFRTYEGTIPNYMIGRFFNDALRKNGYERVETNFWNNRPAVWKVN